ncbi:MAG: hypothetical protein KC931_21725, partial [Candidatus Omnitrophica bacterium]|nr:hypothetical protein [Candidatus Omnitrophota bacterium]
LELLTDARSEKNAITAGVGLLEAALQQTVLLDELLDMREHYFGDSEKYLADSPIIRYLQAASKRYPGSVHQVKESGDDPKETTQAVASETGPSPLIEILKPFADFFDHTSVVNLLDDEEDKVFRKELVKALRDPSELTRLDPRLETLLVAYLSPLDSAEVVAKVTPWLEWGQSVFSDPAWLELMAKLDEGEFPDMGLIGRLEPYVKSMPPSAISQKAVTDLIVQANSVIQAAREITEASESDRIKELARLASDGFLVIRKTLHQSKVFLPFSEFLDRLIDRGDAATIAGHLEMASSEVEFLRLWQENLRLATSKDRPAGALSPSEERLWTLIGRVVWFSSMPDGKQPDTIVFDETNGSIGFDPPCPELSAWIREAITGDTNLGEGNAYPYMSEALLFDLILRTMDDQTPNGYDHTEFGKLRVLFRSLAGQSIEQYVADTFRTPETGASAVELSTPQRSMRNDLN